MIVPNRIEVTKRSALMNFKMSFYYESKSTQ